MYEFQKGEIIFDDKYNIKDIDINSLQDHIGYVLQDPFLFTGTILDNMLLGAPNANEGTVKKAINAVGANTFIDLMPERLLTPVRERGKGFSQGQKQLLAFARVLIKNPSILILDEASSSVDIYTEKMIQDALNIIFKDRTTLIIAHRLSTVINADRIIVLDNGKIIEDGVHKELISKGGKYKELYEMYYAHQGKIESVLVK
jgi:ATP-binding cassette subfamily B protein